MEQLELFESIDKTIKVFDEPDPWLDLIANMPSNVADNLKDAQLVDIEDGIARIAAGKGTDWLNNRLGKSVARELKLAGYEVNEVVFVE